MGERPEDQTDEDQEQHIGNSSPAENGAEQVCSKDKQADYGDNQANLARRQSVGEGLVEGIYLVCTVHVFLGR